jgi:hypothetical protein
VDGRLGHAAEGSAVSPQLASLDLVELREPPSAVFF